MEEERSLVFACLRFALEVVLRAERRAFETVGVELNGFMVVKIGGGGLEPQVSAHVFSCGSIGPAQGVTSYNTENRFRCEGEDMQSLTGTQ